MVGTGGLASVGMADGTGDGRGVALGMVEAWRWWGYGGVSEGMWGGQGDAGGGRQPGGVSPG